MCFLPCSGGHALLLALVPWCGRSSGPTQSGGLHCTESDLGMGFGCWVEVFWVEGSFFFALLEGVGKHARQVLGYCILNVKTQVWKPDPQNRLLWVQPLGVSLPGNDTFPGSKPRIEISSEGLTGT